MQISFTKHSCDVFYKILELWKEKTQMRFRQYPNGFSQTPITLNREQMETFMNNEEITI